MKQSVRKLPTRLHWWALCAAAVIAIPARAYTQSLGEKQQRKRNDELLQSAVKDANKACETGIVVAWDWSSFKGKLIKDGYHVGANCGVGAGDIKYLCNGGGDDAKKTVKAGIRTFLCKGDGGKTGKVHLDKKSKTLIYSTSVEVEKQFRIQEYLKENL